MAYNEIRLRPLTNAERRQMRDGMALLRSKWNPFLSVGPTEEYFDALNSLLAGPFLAFPPIPPWTLALWAEDNEELASTVLQREFDKVVNNCDLSRLSVFIRSRDGQVVKEFMKSAWNRVTLCVDSSIYGLFHGDYCLVCFETPELVFAQRFGGPAHNQQQDRDSALAMLHEKVALMSHNTTQNLTLRHVM